MSKPRIRPIEEADWPQVHALLVEVASAGETYAMDVPQSVEETREFWSGQQVVVAVDGDTVLGSAKLGPNRPAQGAHVGTASFIVGTAARGRGIGRAMGEYAVEWHRANGFAGDPVQRRRLDQHRRVRLWQSLGFETIGTVPDAFRLPVGRYADLHVMYLRVAATMNLAEIRRYPVKSMGGESMRSVDLDTRGLVGDRWFSVVDADGKLASGKNSRRFRRYDAVFEYRRPWPTGRHRSSGLPGPGGPGTPSSTGC